MAIIDEIIAERTRQIAKEGWLSEHDDEHDDGQMAMAAACYAAPVKIKCVMHVEIPCGCREASCTHSAFPSYKKLLRWAWPWNEKWWKPTTPRRNLIKAAALIVAEIERIDRAQQKELTND